MPRLINLDQTLIFTITDETQGGMQYEMKMTVAEVFDKFFDGFQLEVVDAIPVEWLKQWRDKLKGMGEYQHERAEDISFVLGLWQKEQEG